MVPISENNTSIRRLNTGLVQLLDTYSNMFKSHDRSRQLAELRIAVNQSITTLHPASPVNETILTTLRASRVEAMQSDARRDAQYPFWF